jgi:hypothetical protein
MKSDYPYLKKLLDLVLKLSSSNESDDIFDLSSIRDYFFFLTLDAMEESDEHAYDLFKKFSKLEVICEEKGDKFHERFFFTLSELLSLKHRIRTHYWEDVSREHWENRFKITRRRRGI